MPLTACWSILHRWQIGGSYPQIAKKFHISLSHFFRKFQHDADAGWLRSPAYGHDVRPDARGRDPGAQRGESVPDGSISADRARPPAAAPARRRRRLNRRADVARANATTEVCGLDLTAIARGDWVR